MSEYRLEKIDQQEIGLPWNIMPDKDIS